MYLHVFTRTNKSKDVTTCIGIYQYVRAWHAKGHSQNVTLRVIEEKNLGAKHCVLSARWDYKQHHFKNFFFRQHRFRVRNTTLGRDSEALETLGAKRGPRIYNLSKKQSSWLWIQWWSLESISWQFLRSEIGFTWNCRHTVNLNPIPMMKCTLCSAPGR